MKYFTILMSAASLLAFSAQAQAQSLDEPADGNVYVNFGHSYDVLSLKNKYDGETIKQKGKLRDGIHNAMIRTGYRFGVFGFELEGKLNNDTLQYISEDSGRVYGTTLKLPFQIGGFATAAYPISDNFVLHGRLGLVYNRVNVKTVSATARDNLDILLKGVDSALDLDSYSGVEFELVDKFTHNSKNVFSLALGIGAQYNFDDKNGIRLDYTYQVSKAIKEKIGDDTAKTNMFGHSLSLAYVRSF